MDDTLSTLSMGSVAHINDEKKELLNEVNQLTRLGVQLVDTKSIISLKFQILICCRCQI